jgi:putative methyltransferase (TIGR04325 family)
MRETAKAFAKELIPPLVMKAAARLASRLGGGPAHGWFGDFATWQQAQAQSTGYDAGAILDKVKAAVLKVKNGEAAFERDSVLFDRIEYTWPLLSALLWIAARQGGRLNIIDFGGSLGSTYFQNQAFLKQLPEVHWNIVEQAQFVETGKKYFADEVLHFFPSLADCIDQRKPDAVLLSSVLPYLEHPYQLLEEVIRHNFACLVFDKMPLIGGATDRITVQQVPPQIYAASYPAWFFSESKFLSFMSRRYEVLAEFTDPVQANIPSVFKGFIMYRKG